MGMDTLQCGAETTASMDLALNRHKKGREHDDQSYHDLHFDGRVGNVLIRPLAAGNRHWIGNSAAFAMPHPMTWSQFAALAGPRDSQHTGDIQRR